MEYLILNEESIPFQAKEQIDKSFLIFLKILEDTFKTRIKAIRLSENLDKGWFEIMLTPNYTVREWLKTQEIDLERRVKSIITKTEIPQIPEDETLLLEQHFISAFYLKEFPDLKVPSLGATYLLNQLAISFESNPRWLQREIVLIHEQLHPDEIKYPNGIIKFECTVQNCADWDSWNHHKTIIEAKRQSSAQKGQNLWLNRTQYFPHLVFCGKTKDQLTKLSVSNTVFNQLWEALTKLNGYCKPDKDYSLSSIIQETQLNISDESETVKNNPKLKRHRLFTIEGEKKFFGFHIKNFSGAFRMHFFPSSSKGVIYIGYFGKHLPTAKD